MLNLVLYQLQGFKHCKAMANFDFTPAIRQATVDAGKKTNAIQQLFALGGSEALLSVGQGILQATYDPLWHAAVRASSPGVLFDRWRRFETIAHSTNRVKITPLTDRAALFNRYTMDGHTPGFGENLLICGLIISLLEHIGCAELSCSMPLRCGGTIRLREAGRFAKLPAPEHLNTAAWHIEWQHYAPATRVADRSLVSLPFLHSPVVAEVSQLLAADVMRQWTLAEVASCCHTSKRSLQRRLSEAGWCFSSLVRLVRIHEARRLLEETDTSITAIGFCAGFSDSAHFSRDFKASTGASPAEYRKLMRGTELDHAHSSI